jgi:hypothetical protein
MGTCASYFIPVSVRSKFHRSPALAARSAALQDVLQFSYDTSDTEWLMTSAEDLSSDNNNNSSTSQRQISKNKETLNQKSTLAKNAKSSETVRNSRTPGKVQGLVRDSGDAVPLLSISLESEEEEEEEFCFKTGERNYEFQYKDFPISNCPSPDFLGCDDKNKLIDFPEDNTQEDVLVYSGKRKGNAREFMELQIPA